MAGREGVNFWNDRHLIMYTKEQSNKVQSPLVTDILVGQVGLEPTTGRL